jgi:hypothetical protein
MFAAEARNSAANHHGGGGGGGAQGNTMVKMMTFVLLFSYGCRGVRSA